jgi:hypothetical protein
MPSNVAAALSVSAGLAVSEINGTLTAVGRPTAAALAAWREVAETCAADRCRLTCRDDLEDVHDLRTADLEELKGTDLRLTLEIIHPDNVVHVATPEGLRRVLAALDNNPSVSVVRLLGLVEPILTLGVGIEPWIDGDGDAGLRTMGPSPSPRRFARTIAGSTKAPLEIGSWVLEGNGDRSDHAFKVWRSFSANAVRRSLVNEIYDADGAVRVVLAGTPTRRLELGEAEVDAASFATLQGAARWVYVEGPDAELRHALVTNELAREWRDGEPFAIGLGSRLPVALESAGLAYRAHVQQGSKDTIKSLSDLRKTLAEEMGKVTQQTRDLTSGLWRDVAVAIVAIAFRYSMDASKIMSVKPAYALIFVLVAAYIISSQMVTVHSNRAFLKVASDARTLWRRKGYAYLSDDEFDELAGTPLSEARGIYDWVETTANWVAGVVAAGLIVSAGWEIHVWQAFFRRIAALSCG